MKKFKNIKFCIAAIIMLALTGCYDKVELEDRGFIMAVGVDKYKAEEEHNKTLKKPKGNKESDKNKYSMTGYKNKEENKKDNGESDNNNGNNKEENQVIKFKNETSNPRFVVTTVKANAKSLIGESDEGNFIISASDETIAGALNTIHLHSNQSMYLGYAQLVVIGQEILNNQELFKETIDTLERNRELNREIFIVASQENASDILSQDIKTAKSVEKFVSKLYKNNNRLNLSSSFYKTLESLSSSLYTTGSALIPKIVIEDDYVKLDGLAVIKDFEFIGWLDDSAVKGYLWANGKGEGISIVTNFNDVYVPLDITKNTVKINFEEENGRIICKVDLNVYGTIQGYSFGETELFNEEVLSILSSKYEEIILNQIEKTFYLFQNVYLIDGLQLVETLRKKNNDLYLKYANMPGSFKNMEMQTNVSVKIKNVGSIK